VRAAVFFWVGSETDWNGVGASYRKSPFSSRVSEATKVDQILDWLDLPQAERPRLVMSYWRGVDHVAHRAPDHADVFAELRGQDAQLARLLAGLDQRRAWGHTTLIIVSDHGMTSVTRVVAVREALKQAGIRARVPGGSGVAYVFLEDRSEIDAAERVLRALEGARVFRSQQIPAKLRIRHPRAGDLLVATDPPNTLIEGDLLAYARRTPDWTRGMHGYAPDHPDMAGIFLALGRGVPRGGRLAQVRAIDVAPTLTELLGIDPPRHAEGEPISGIGVLEGRP
jgi:predicted AlkP superfamily pyrophosphatase or phosphodiesterase